jgi:hypothetical protein
VIRFLKVIELLPHPQRLLQLFCIVDELVTIILSQTLFLEKSGKTPGRPHNLTISEAMTISLYRFLFPWTDFKHYYGFVQNYHSQDFINLPHYDNMLTQQKQMLPFFLQFLGILIAINRSAFKDKKIRIMFIDASPLPVCANKRIFNHKVAKKAAKRGKSTMGWFFGFKLHILIDDGGNILGVTITPGNVDDRTQVKKLVGDIMNSLLIADAGYLKGILQQELFEKNGIQFITGVKRTMKKLMTPQQHSLLRARQLVETVIGSLKNRLGMSFRLHRSIEGYKVHFVLTLIAYTLFKSLARIPLLSAGKQLSSP